MAPWEEFDSAFQFNKKYAYDGQTVEQIRSNRQSLENVLFVDRLLRLLGINAASRVYPPKSNQELRNLYKQIIASTSPNHHKQSLIYYILRDCKKAGDSPAQFARSCYLPEKYRLFIDGLWHLDRLEFRPALEYLTEPSLIPTFPDEILHVLIKLSRGDSSLPMAYYLTVSPPLASPEVRQAYFALLCSTSVTEAFYFARNQDEKLHRELFEQLIHHVHSASPGEPRRNNAMELINLPFSEQEDTWFEDALLRGSSKNLNGARDTVLMRRVATGNLRDLDGDFDVLAGRKVDGLNWDDLKQSLNKSLGPTSTSL
ncbi:hypothetical protein FQN54_002585 [Arachnomyces sp. PD_36]|nr:hypothetical protein FQN54_002585 [Arachnomyces sp. PD_36]